MTELVGLGWVAVFAVGGVAILRWRLAAAEAKHRRTFELRFPRTFDASGAAQVVRALGGLSAPWWGRWLSAPAVVFEVRADASGVRHLVRVPERFADFLTAQLAGAGVRFEECPDEKVAVSSGVEFCRPSLIVSVSTDEAVASGMLAAMQPLRRGQCAVMQTVVRPAASPRQAALDPARAWWRQAFGNAPATPSPASAAAVRAWSREPALAASLRIGVTAGSTGAERHLLGRLTGAVNLSRSHALALRRRWLPGPLVAAAINRGSIPARAPALLRASELAVLLALPLDGPPAPGLSIAGARQLVPATALPRTGRVLGEATYPGAERPVALARPEGTTRHMWAIGPSGTGKSTLTLRAALDDVASGAGVCIVDPVKGDLIADFIDCLPPERADDLIVLDAADTAQPVGFNPLTERGTTPELAADGMLHIFRHLARTRWGGSWGPRLEDTMRASLITLSRAGLTLCELPTLLLNSNVRTAIVAGLDDPLGVGPFWNWYAGLSDGEREQVAAPVVNKVRGFVVSPSVRNIIGQRQSAFSLADVLSQGKILCVSLPRGVIGEDAATLIGAAVVSSLWRAILGRAALPPAARRPFCIHIDEFQEVVALPLSLGEALATSRGLGVGWAVNNQHAAQLPADLRAAVLANARTRVCFQLGGQDAALFAKEFSPYATADDLTALAPFEAMAAVAVGANVAPPVTIRTRPAPPPSGHGAKVRAQARARYGRDREAVEGELRARLEGAAEPVAIGSRRRR